MLHIVIGGGLSGIGKGFYASALAKKVKAKTIIKYEPYLNESAGFLSPDEHGEVYVLRDGTECDLDLGQYERILRCDLTKDNFITNGALLSESIRSDRKENLGQTIRINHVVNRLYDKILSIVKQSVEGENIGVNDYVMEIGGSIGDAEHFLVKPLLQRLTPDITLETHLHVLVPIFTDSHTGECKTNIANKALDEISYFPTYRTTIVYRSENNIPNEHRDIILKKLFSRGLKYFSVYFLKDCTAKEKIVFPTDVRYENYFGPIISPVDATEQLISNKIVCIVGKYSTNIDSYKSVVEKVKAAGVPEKNIRIYSFTGSFPKADKYILTGGFGTKNIKKYLKMIAKLREMKADVFGICLGYQLMAIDWMNHVSDCDNYTSEEFAELFPDAKKYLFRLSAAIEDGGMFLGEYALMNGTFRRYRHRYIKDRSISLSQYRCEIVTNRCLDEDPAKVKFPWGKNVYGVQYHPEFGIADDITDFIWS